MTGMIFACVRIKLTFSLTNNRLRSITNTCFRESLGEILISLVPKGNDGSAAHPQREQVALSTLNTELEIKILGIIAESQAEGGEPIVAPNPGAMRAEILDRLGLKCDNRKGKAGRLIGCMNRKGVITRQDHNTWGLSPRAARSRCRELKRELEKSSEQSDTPSLMNILSGLTAPSAVATV